MEKPYHNIDQTAFIALVRQQEPKIRNLIRTHISNKERQKDLFQDVLLEAWKSIKNFKGKSSFGTWLYRIATNIIFLSFRKAQRNIKIVVTSDSFDTAQEVKQRSPQAERLHRAVQSLPMVDKSIVTAHLDGFSNEEIAEILGLTKNNVAVKLHRIKLTLKEKLNK